MSVGNNPNKAEAPEKSAATAGAGKGSGSGEKGESLPEFLAATWQEFRKISWPSRQQVIQETWSVIVLVTAFTLVVLAFDWAVAKVVFEPLDKFAKHMGGGVGRTTQNWGNLNQPGVPNNQPGAPGNAPATPSSSPTGPLNTPPVPPAGPTTTTGGASAPAPAAPPPATTPAPK